VLADVLHYWPWDRQQLVIASACAALRPGGMLVFRTPRPTETRLGRMAAWSILNMALAGALRASI
jgi:hypothetical protein